MNKSRCEFYTDFIGNISGDQRKLSCYKETVKSVSINAFSAAR